MPVACRNCRNAGLACRVHVRSGRCGQCNSRNLLDCNIRISEEEWDAIRETKRRLTEEIEKSRLERLRLEELRNSLESNERRLRAEMEENDRRAAEAISVEEQDIQRLERLEAAEASSSAAGFALSPFTWSVMDGLPDDAWEADAPSFLATPMVIPSQ